MTPLDTLLALAGLDYLRAVLAGDVPPAPMGVALGFRLHAADPGTATFRGTPSPAFANPAGAVHGGWYGAILDSALGCAALTKLPKGQTYTTLEYKVNLTRAIPMGMEVEARATVDHAGRRTLVASATLTGVEDGKLYATGSTTCIVLAP
jgi:uncharacterized protein (TIGR00369 family)